MPSSIFSLKGRCALVTGASAGIGFGIAKAMAKTGADVILVARDPARLEEARTELVSSGHRIAAIPFDLSRYEDIGTLYERVMAASVAPDILVNNAGTTRRGPAHELTWDDWQAVMAVNFHAVFGLCREFARERIAAGKKGKIINIASVMSEATRAGTACYTASKGGVRQLTTALALDWASYDIQVNAIGPGFIKTPLTKPLQEQGDFDAWVRKRTPAGRWGKPEDVAGAAVFLASSASDFITGQTFYVDGGLLSAL